MNYSQRLTIAVGVISCCAVFVQAQKLPPVGSTSVQVWSTIDTMVRLADAPILPGIGSGGQLVGVSPNERYQTMHGIGSSLEESTVYNLRLLSLANRLKALQEMIAPDQTAMNLMRICLGTADFTSVDTFYTYADRKGPADSLLKYFTIQKDRDLGIIEVLKLAMTINPQVRFVASPWSPPAWMKTNNSIVGGSFDSTYAATLAQYLRMAIEAYAAEGIPIWALTVQNEPLYNAAYPGCLMTPGQEAAIVKFLRREFESHACSTKVLVYDHNADALYDYTKEIYADTAAAAGCWGAALHGYWGEFSEATRLHNAFPGKEICFTERSYWGISGFSNVIDILRNWCSTYLAWVSMLDDKRAPTRWPGVPDETWWVRISGDTTYRRTPSSYMIGNFTKFIARGAQRMGSSMLDSLSTVAFVNPDSTAVMVMANRGGERTIRVTCSTRHFTATLPPRSITTCRWVLDSNEIKNSALPKAHAIAVRDFIRMQANRAGITCAPSIQRLECLTLTGRLIRTWQRSPGPDGITAGLDGLAPGVYLLVATSDAGRAYSVPLHFPGGHGRRG
jgi:glucosylceramidase